MDLVVCVVVVWLVGAGLKAAPTGCCSKLPFRIYIAEMSISAGWVLALQMTLRNRRCLCETS